MIIDWVQAVVAMYITKPNPTQNIPRIQKIRNMNILLPGTYFPAGLPRPPPQRLLGYCVQV